MYFPYLRGRQYELLALKQLAQNGLLSDRIIPVVEPIRLTSTLGATLRAFADAKLRIALIFNPAVGAFSDGNSSSFTDAFYSGIDDSYNVSQYVLPTLLMNKKAASVVKILEKKGVPRADMAIIIDNRDFIDDYKTEFSETIPQYTLFPDERKIRPAVSQNKVIFEDRFKKQERNADYLKQVDEFFSDDHLYYSTEGFSGFGDYSIIGTEYTESGFAPYAVAFHVVYFDDEKTLRICHFVSNSNSDTSDVGGKFREALEKYINWQRECPNIFNEKLTSGMSILNRHWDMGTFPGLPTLKRLSVMHHLELMSRYLGEEALA